MTETPEEFAERVVIEYRSGPYSLRKVLLDNVASRDAQIRKECAERAIACVKNDFNSEMRDLWGDYEDGLLCAAIVGKEGE